MINLLPAIYKEELKREERTRLVFILMALIILFLISLSLLLFAIRIYLAGQIQAQEVILEAQREGFQEYRSVKEQIQNINLNISNISTFYEQKTGVSEVLNRISSVLPSGFYLTSFRYIGPDVFFQGQNQAGKGMAQISVNGFTPTRDALLLFRDTLERDALFVRVVFLQSNFETKENINFSFSAELDMVFLSTEE
ncbi:hypothetical protein IID24_01760 [Patescibacteria group bacterium]|nr:hypothetical protein [Patescibacteria group bacterium]